MEGAGQEFLPPQVKQRKSKAGRPKYQPTDADRETVKSMAAAGFKHERIALCLGDNGIADKTLRKHFRRELDIASDQANDQVARRVLKAALTGEYWACALWLKCRAGWKETTRQEVTGADGAPVEFTDSRESILRKLASLSPREGSPQVSGASQPEGT